MTVSKKPRRKSPQRSSAKRRAHSSHVHSQAIEAEIVEPTRQTQEISQVQPAPGLPPLETLAQQWWSSWRRANALGWEYLDAASGVFRQNMAALASATRPWPRGPDITPRR